MPIGDTIKQLETELAAVGKKPAASPLHRRLAATYLELGGYALARQHLDQALTLTQSAPSRKDPAEEGEILLLFGRLLARTGERDQAVARLEAIGKIAVASGQTDLDFRARLERLPLLCQRGDDLAAREELQELSRLLPDPSRGENAVRFLLVRAEILGETEAAFRARELAGQGDLPFLTLAAELALAKLYRRQGDPETAFRHGLLAQQQLEHLAPSIPASCRDEFWRNRAWQLILSGLEAAGPPEKPGKPGASLPAAVELRSARLLLDNYRRLGLRQELGPLLDEWLESLLALVPAERVMVLGAEKGGGPAVVASRNFGQDPAERSAHRFSTTALNLAMATGRLVLTGNAATCRNLIEASSLAAFPVKSLLVLPIKLGERVLGAVYLDNRFRENAFDEDDVRLLERGADQFALAIEHLRLREENTARQREIERLQGALRESGARPAAFPGAVPHRPRPSSGLVADAPAMQPVLERLEKVKDHNLPVLIWGESGTGKELLARTLHLRSRWGQGPFVSLHCAAVPTELIASELFGYVPGAFTGADRDKEGLFEQARDGTLFLDELSDMPEEMQKQILRVLQEKEIRRVGGSQVIRINTRLVAALNRHPEDLLREKRLRKDLYYLLNVVTLHLPPLRERREDIPGLVEHFLAEIGKELQVTRRVAPEALSLLVRHDWPGNIRELGNFLKRLAACHGEELITGELVRRELSGAGVPGGPGAGNDLYRLPFKKARRAVIDRFEREYLALALARHQGNKARTAAELGIRHSYVHKLLARHQTMPGADAPGPAGKK